MKHRGRFILLDDASVQNGFNKNLGRTIKAWRLGRIQFNSNVVDLKPRQRGQEMLDGLNPDFAEFQNGASLCSTSKLHQRGDLHRRL